MTTQVQIKLRSGMGCPIGPAKLCAVVEDMIYRKELNCSLSAARTFTTVLFNNFNPKLVLPSETVSGKAPLTWLSALCLFSVCHPKHFLRFYLTALTAFNIRAAFPCRCLKRVVDVLNSATTSTPTAVSTSSQLGTMKFPKRQVRLTFRAPFFSRSSDEGRVF